MKEKYTENWASEYALESYEDGQELTIDYDLESCQQPNNPMRDMHYYSISSINGVSWPDLNWADVEKLEAYLWEATKCS